ncbi:hypothetical protein ACFL23_00625 [Patescibacteria group bacterium]
MNIVIDPTILYTLGSKHPFIIALHLFRMFGWVPIVFVLIWGLWKVWMNFIQDQFVDQIKFVLLAIDVPKNNLQTPKAVEQIFAQLAGAHSTPNFLEKYWDGYVQPWFSLEIISIGGYVQFLIYTPEVFRDLVEAAIYAQYHDAEITEIEDYVDKLPQKYPNEEYDFWGTELILVKPNCYPIRMYDEFEHSISKEMKDPMAALLEMMSKLQNGEQAWLQILINPINQDWTAKSDKEVRSLIKEVAPSSKALPTKAIDSLLGGLHSVADSMGQIIVPESGVDGSEDKKKNEMYNIVMNLTEGDKEIISGIQKKAAKIGYETKIRQMYIGKKEVFSKQRGVSGIFGAIKQFNTNDKNSIKPEQQRIITKVNYFFKKTRVAIRQTKLMAAYKLRSFGRGTAKIGILNIEELATLWHFPMEQVKTPLIRKTEVRKAEPPYNLPKHEKREIDEDDSKKNGEEEEVKGAPPANLPFE